MIAALSVPLYEGSTATSEAIVAVPVLATSTLPVNGAAAAIPLVLASTLCMRCAATATGCSRKRSLLFAVPPVSCSVAPSTCTPAASCAGVNGLPGTALLSDSRVSV